jgi:ribosomal protein S15P/S13E
MGKKLIKKDEKVGLKLTVVERKLMLEDPSFIPDELAEPIRATAPGDPVMLMLDDLGDLHGHVAAETNHTKDKKVRQRLYAISEKILSLLDIYDDEPEVTGSPATIPFPVHFVEDDLAPLVEPLPTKSENGEDQYGVKLTEKQRESLLDCTELSEELRSKIQQAGAGTQTLGLTRDELDELTSEVDLAIFESRPPHKQRLTAVYDKLENLLDAIELDEEDEQARHQPERTGMIYRLKITLADAKPAIWRRVEVPDLTLGELHEVIQVVMGWQNSHMHQFIVNGKYFGEAMTDDLDLDVEDEDGIRISQVFPDKKRARIVYEYDFGDSWLHDIVLEKTSEPEPKVKYPRCIEGARACPPEDCGGIGGYAEFLEAISDPKHPEHRDMKEWIGGKFDPDKFSVDNMNRELKNFR